MGGVYQNTVFYYKQLNYLKNAIKRVKAELVLGLANVSILCNFLIF